MIHHFRLVNILPVLIFFGLFGMGITLPVLELYGHNPEVFIANRSSSAQIVVFALIVAFLPAAVMGVIWCLARAINLRAGEIMELLGISIAGFFVSASLLRYVMESTNLSLAIAIPVGILLGLNGRHQGIVRNWLSYLIIVPVISLISFLVFSDSAGLLWEKDAKAESNANISNPIPVVMLVMDEFPLTSLLDEGGKLNDSLFPNFSRIAESSIWFRNFATNSIATTDSVPIILSGVLKEGAKPTSSDHPKTLFTLLGESYDMHVNESVTSLCPDSICKSDAINDSHKVLFERTDGSLRLLLDDALIVYGHIAMPPLVRSQLPSIDGRWGGFLDGEGTTTYRENLLAGHELPPAPKGGRPSWINKLLAAIDQFATAKTQSLHYTHIMAPHIPWNVNPSGTVYQPPEQTSTLVAGVENGYWIQNPALSTQGYQRHLSKLGAVDLLLGYYVDELQRTGLWDEALVIITADHGASFAPGSHRRWVEGDNANALYRVPLFIHLPGQDSAEIRDEPAFSIDILPTIVDILGISVNWPLRGLSFLGRLPQERSHDYIHFTGKRIALEMRLEDLWKEVAKNYILIPDTSSWESVAAVGPHRNMVGKSLDQLGVIENIAIKASFDGFENDVVTDKQTGKLPTILKGRVRIPSGYVTGDVLVAVNGWVRGAGYAIRDSGDTFDFTTYVPESAFRQGRNRVNLVVPSETGQWFYSFTGEVSKTVLSDEDGNPLNIVPRGQRLVRIDAVEFENGMLRARGWSADTGEKILPKRILIYFGDKLLYAAPLNVERKDVTIWFNSDDLILSGFDFRFPVDDVPENIERVTIVALFSDNAVLNYATLQR
jgi:hypothetical protein